MSARPAIRRAKISRITPELIEAVLNQRALGYSVSGIAANLGIPHKRAEYCLAVARKANDPRATVASPEVAERIAQNVAKRVNKQTVGRKDRECLRCQSMFPSHGPGNRICGGCKNHDVFGSSGMDCTMHARVSVNGARA